MQEEGEGEKGWVGRVGFERLSAPVVDDGQAASLQAVVQCQQRLEATRLLLDHLHHLCRLCRRNAAACAVSWVLSRGWNQQQ